MWHAFLYTFGASVKRVQNGAEKTHFANFLAAKQRIVSHTSRRTISVQFEQKTSTGKVCCYGSLVGLYKQDYKSLCAAVTICSISVNIKTYVQAHTHADSILTRLY